jgi:LmbE family N-acetylglucosaminyl deacetylase
MRILAVAAHPDDETLGAGGTLAHHALMGDEVWVLILTDGVTSRLGAQRIADREPVVRHQECALRAADILGVKRTVFGGLPDQRLDTLSLLDLITPIEQCIDELQPDILLTHFKEDANQDHRLVFQAALVAARPRGDSTIEQFVCFETASSTEWAAPFPGSVFAPNVFVDISDTLSVKLDAMRCYEDSWVGEVRPYPHPRSYEAIEAYAKRHGAVAAVGAAEPFMLVRQVLRLGFRGSERNGA